MNGSMWHNTRLEGRDFLGTSEWEGHQPWVEGDVLGLEVNFDARILTAAKNNEQLGVLAEVVSGELCWAVSLERKGDCVSIARVLPQRRPPHKTHKTVGSGLSLESLRGHECRAGPGVCHTPVCGPSAVCLPSVYRLSRLRLAETAHP